MRWQHFALHKYLMSLKIQPTLVQWLNRQSTFHMFTYIGISCLLILVIFSYHFSVFMTWRLWRHDNMLCWTWFTVNSYWLVQSQFTCTDSGACQNASSVMHEINGRQRPFIHTTCYIPEDWADHSCCYKQCRDLVLWNYI